MAPRSPPAARSHFHRPAQPRQPCLLLRRRPAGSLRDLPTQNEKPRPDDSLNCFCFCAAARRVLCCGRMSDSLFRRTKIIFTLGPATESEAMLEQLIRGGADVVRLNMAHAKHDWTRTTIRRIRAISARVGREVAIMMDIKGPEIRTGDLASPIELKPGEIFDFTVQPGGAR